MVVRCRSKDSKLDDSELALNLLQLWSAEYYLTAVKRLFQWTWQKDQKATKTFKSLLCFALLF